MRDRLMNEILNEVLFELPENMENWELEETEYDLEKTHVTVTNEFPENPRTLTDIESFDVEEEVVGRIIYTYKRKNNERSQQNS